MQNSKSILSVAALGLIQGSNFITQLLIFPLILYKLGVEKFSELVIAESIALLVLLITNYSFEVSGIGKVQNTDSLSKTFSLITSTRFLILFLIFALSIIFWIYNRSELSLLIIIWLIFPLSQILQHHYLFLAKNNLQFYSSIVLSSRLSALIVLHIYLEKGESIIVSSFLLNIIFLFSSIVCTIYAFKTFRIRFKIPRRRELIISLYEGKEIIIGNLGVYIFQDVNILLLKGLLASTNNIALSIYSISEKLARSLRASIRPFNQWAFKNGIQKLKPYNEPSINVRFVIWEIQRKQVIGLLFIYAFCLLILRFFSDSISVILGVPIQRVFKLFIFMGLAPVIGIGNYMFGTFGLNYLNMGKKLMNIRLISGVIALTITSILIKFYHENGGAISYLLAEIILLGLTLRYYSKVNDYDV